MMHWLYIFVVGLIIGIVAKFIMPGKDGGGIIITAILGILGALLGGWLAGLLGMASGGIIGFVFAVIGALIILFAYGVVTGKR